MAIKLILDEGGANQFDFSSLLLSDDFSIPAAKPNEQGRRKLERGIILGLSDYEKLTIPVGFKLTGATSEAMLQSQQTLLAALRQPRNKLTWNPNPSNCSDIYFDTYASPLETPLRGITLQTFVKAHIDLLCDPFPYGAEVTLYDSAGFMELVEPSGTAGTWTGSGTITNDTSLKVWGTDSKKVSVTPPTEPQLSFAATTPVDLSGYSAAGYITLSLYFPWGDGYWYFVPPNPWPTFIFRVGSDASNYREWSTTAIAGANGSWGALTFDLNSGYTTTGTPNMGAIDYYYFALDNFAPSSMNIDDVYITSAVGGGNMRSVLPAVISLSDLPGEYPGGFQTELDLGSGKVADRIFIASDSDGNTYPAGYTTPQSPSSPPAGGSWEANPSATSDANCYQGTYYRWSITTTAKRVFPVYLYANQHEGEVRVQARVRNNNVSGGGYVRVVGYDYKAGEWTLGDEVFVAASANWQIIDLGQLGLPLDGFHRDAAPANVYSVIGLAIRGATTTANWDVNFTAFPSPDGGALYGSPTAGRRYVNFDTRYHDSAGLAQSASTSVDEFQRIQHRAVGDLRTVGPGDLSLWLNAQDSANPNTVQSVTVRKITYVPRFKNGKP